MAIDDEGLQSLGLQHYLFESAENSCAFEPPQHGRVTTGALISFSVRCQLAPVDGGICVVLDVVAVVEEEEVVEGTVVAGSAANVLVFALEPAEDEAGEVGGDVSDQEELGG